MSRKKAAGVTRNEILDVAWDLIAEKGVEVSLKDIGAAADVSRQTVYLHFRSRGGLLMALVQRADERFTIREQFFEAAQEPDPAVRLDRVLQVWFDFAVKIRPVASDLIRLRSTDADANAAWEDRMSELRDWERELVSSLAADGALAAVWTIDEATDYLWAASSVQMWNLLTGDRGWSADKSTRVLRRAIASALLTPD